MATLLEALETTCANLSVKCHFNYADIDEANAVIYDSLKEFPVCLILPFDINDNGRGGPVITSETEVNALFLDKIDAQETIDKPTTEIESKVIAPMRALAREFCNRLETTDIIHEDGITSSVNRSVHKALTDAYLYGCWAVFTIKFSEDIATHVCE